MRKFIEGVVSGGNNRPPKPVQVGGDLDNVDKIVEKLGGIAQDNATIEHGNKLNAARKKLVKLHKVYEQAIENGSGVEQAREALLKHQKEISGTIKDANKHVRGVKAFARGQKLRRFATSKVGMGLIAAAGAIGALSWMNSRRNNQEKLSYDELRANQTASMKADIAAMQQHPATQAGTMMGMQPVVGDHANRVLAARGGMGTGIDVSQPQVDMPYEVART
ncbi:MAG: hypothetical protein R3D71_08640 [Rickettsiales bacterium]